MVLGGPRWCQMVLSGIRWCHGIQGGAMPGDPRCLKMKQYFHSWTQMVSGGTRWCHCLDKRMHATSTSIAHLHNTRAPIYLRSQNCFLMNQCASLERIIRRPLVWGGRGQNGRQAGLSASQRVRGAGWVGGFCDFWHSQYYKIGILPDFSTPETPQVPIFWWQWPTQEDILGGL